MPQIESRPIMETVRKWWLAGVDLIFPSRCAACGHPGDVLCQRCKNDLSLIRSSICNTCGKPTAKPVRSCDSCIEYPPAFKVRALARYSGPIIGALLHLKYRPNRELAQLMAAWLNELISRNNWSPTLIIPVPLGMRRLRSRGYNQASLIAVELSRYSSIDLQEKGLVRTRETLSQVGLNPLARQQNVEGAFRAEANLVKDKEVLLVDDLVTTGATLSACARALNEAGVRRVFGLSVARA